MFVINKDSRIVPSIRSSRLFWLMACFLVTAALCFGCKDGEDSSYASADSPVVPRLTEPSSSSSTEPRDNSVTVAAQEKKWVLNHAHRVVTPSLPYYLYYEKDTYTLSVYGQEGNGYYSKLVKTISSSRGRTPNMTPTGVFKLEKQKRWYQFLIGKYWTQYCIRYTGDIYMHGPLYREARGDTMHIKEYNRNGTASTSGCLAMVTADIKWIWDNCPDGTTLEIVNGATIGTTANAPERISENGPAIDPTDPEF